MPSAGTPAFLSLSNPQASQCYAYFEGTYPLSGQVHTEEDATLTCVEEERYPTLIIKQKLFTVDSTYKYRKMGPSPVTAAETKDLVQKVIKPRYSCTQCSSSIQNQDCIFLGWGKHCNNCKAASKSLCLFCAEPVQRYLARKELASFIEATPKYVQAAIHRSNMALQVFKSSANNAALAGQQFQQTLEETYFLCLHVLTNEGEEALKGVIFDESGLTEQLHEALKMLDAMSRILFALYSPLNVFCPPFVMGPVNQNTTQTMLNEFFVTLSSNVDASSSSTITDLAAHLCNESPGIETTVDLGDRETHVSPPSSPHESGKALPVPYVKESGEVSPFGLQTGELSIVPGTPGADTDYKEVSFLWESHNESPDFVDNDEETPKAPPKNCCAQKAGASIPNVKKTLGRNDIV
ncbi:uncharacterized protein ARMOST_17740 [Armillaria ostoyae]|uniref:Uncharacterized protein n=1 Tax=Armillaria ostoyae TaxID=47428 RepID=A0A284RZV3_ARMOS|nr:uncharacterized protein ARMOST_17740 [Armillaria ostoyae]